MNIKKQYPKLYPVLVKVFGARRAKQKLLELHEDRARINLCDTSWISCAFVWIRTRDGLHFWHRKHTLSGGESYV